jgi:hypothetical protein
MFSIRPGVLVFVPFVVLCSLAQNPSRAGEAAGGPQVLNRGQSIALPLPLRPIVVKRPEVWIS